MARCEKSGWNIGPRWKLRIFSTYNCNKLKVNLVKRSSFGFSMARCEKSVLNIGLRWDLRISSTYNCNKLKVNSLRDLHLQAVLRHGMKDLIF